MVDFRLKKGRGALESEEKLTTEATEFTAGQAG